MRKKQQKEDNTLEKKALSEVLATGSIFFKTHTVDGVSRAGINDYRDELTERLMELAEDDKDNYLLLLRLKPDEYEFLLKSAINSTDEIGLFDWTELDELRLIIRKAMLKSEGLTSSGKDLE